PREFIPDSTQVTSFWSHSHRKASSAAVPPPPSAAIRSLGYEPNSYAVRGGTDGAGLTAMGLPTPNLGTGDRNCHGKFEYVNLNELEKVVEVLKEIVRVSE
ncbi:MAG: hypothetical protein IKF05_05535, partial [Erysipelotrichaceae bacterium]|nr:hypothetical protein [Erysipelotrichaceae bacterium]